MILSFLPVFPTLAVDLLALLHSQENTASMDEPYTASNQYFIFSSLTTAALPRFTLLFDDSIKSTGKWKCRTIQFSAVQCNAVHSLVLSTAV